MADQLQIACPKCAVPMRILRPAAQRARITCTSCSHVFEFNVPPPAPASPTPAFDFDDLPPPSAPASQSPSQPSQWTPPTTGTFHAAGGPLAAKSPSIIKPLIFVTGTIAAILLFVAAGWYLVRKVPMLAGSVSMFDSAQAVIGDANRADAQIAQTLSALANKTDEMDETRAREQLEEISAESYKLVLRAVQVATVSTSESAALVESWESNPAGARPLSEEEKEQLVEQVKAMPRDTAMSMRSTLGHSIRNHAFVREYLTQGHLTLPEPSAPGEQIAAEKVRLLREINATCARLMQGMPTEKPDHIETDEQISQYLDELYSPILSDVKSAATRMNELAEQRYELSEGEIGNTDAYGEMNHYAEMAQSMVMVHGLALVQKKTEAGTAFGDLIKAVRELDRAEAGQMPTRPAQAAEQDAAAKQQREQQQQQQQQQREQQQRLAQQQAQIESEKASDMPQSPAMDSVTQNSRAGKPGDVTDSPFAPPGFGPGASRFGPSGFGPSGPAGPRPSGRPSGSSRPGGPRPGQPGFSRPQIDSKTGVTITMKGTGNLQAQDVSKKLSSLQSAVSVSIRNGELTARTGYTGPIEDVVKLIDFGKVTSTDPEKRIIIVAPQ